MTWKTTFASAQGIGSKTEQTQASTSVAGDLPRTDERRDKDLDGNESQMMEDMISAYAHTIGLAFADKNEGVACWRLELSGGVTLS